MTRARQLLGALLRSLAVYRLVFGQPRQDDLIEFLLHHVPEERLGEPVERLRIDLAPWVHTHGTMSTIDLLRHGEPKGGVRYRGDGVDDPLSERGWAQMWAAVGEFSDWTHVVSSPLRRCRGFAEAVAERYRLPLAVDGRLREVGFGAWEGRRHEEVRDADPDAYYAFFRDAVNHRPPGSEPLDTFYARVRSGILAVFDEHPEGHVLLVCHLGVMRAATALALEMPLSSLYRMHAPYAGRIRLRRTARGIEFWFGH